jgi:8-oxo-dGTP diphosphatase
VLLLHRRHPPNAGLWNGIGGKLEPGEDPYAACIREVREETGLAIGPPALRAVLVIAVQSTGDLWVIFTFTAPAPTAAQIDSEEGELRWVAVDAVDALPVLPDLPLLLPHLFVTDDVLTIRIDLANEEASSMTRAAILGPADRVTTLFPR